MLLLHWILNPRLRDETKWVKKGNNSLIKKKNLQGENYFVFYYRLYSFEQNKKRTHVWRTNFASPSASSSFIRWSVIIKTFAISWFLLSPLFSPFLLAQVSHLLPSLPFLPFLSLSPIYYWITLLLWFIKADLSSGDTWKGNEICYNSILINQLCSNNCYIKYCSIKNTVISKGKHSWHLTD